MSRIEIDDPRKWRISRSGYSIVTGWGDERRTISTWQDWREMPFNAARYQNWLDSAQRICDRHNAELESSTSDAARAGE